MSKDGSGQSSAAVASIHTSSPPAKETSLDLESQQPGEAASGSVQVPPADLVPNQSIVLSAPEPPVIESQPMTASNSASSHPSTKDATSNGAGPATSYGTRSSRNRTGGARPNYAEDKEVDIEFEPPSIKETTGRKGKAVVDQSIHDAPKQTSSARKIAAVDDDPTTLSQSHHKEAIPGTLTFSANPIPVAGSSKKRKATSNATSAQPNLAVPTQSANHSQAVTRRASIMAHNLNGFQDSNMLSFEDCGARLTEDNKLVADDGTVLQVNGRMLLNVVIHIFICKLTAI